MENRTGQTFGPYRLVRFLNEQCFSELYLGQHLQEGRPVLIRVLGWFLPYADEEATFLAELQQLTHFRHPHLLSICDGGLHNHIPFLVMDAPPSRTLLDFLAQSFALEAIDSPITSLAATLEELHAQQVAHRLLYPDEIWIDHSFQLLLSEPLTTFERNHGSRHEEELIDIVFPEGVWDRQIPHMAPEQLEGKPGSCSVSDQYTLALMIYEWLSREPPFKGSGNELVRKYLKGPPSPLREKVPLLPPELVAVVMRGLEKNPNKRFASVQEFATTLSKFLWSTTIQGCCFRVETGSEPGRTYELSRPVVLIGRGSRATLDISLEDPHVARTHARIILLKDGRYGIEDLNHVNGIQVNGRRLDREELSPLQDGDRVQIGQTVLVFEQQRFDTIPL